MLAVSQHTRQYPAKDAPTKLLHVFSVFANTATSRLQVAEQFLHHLSVSHSINGFGNDTSSRPLDLNIVCKSVFEAPGAREQFLHHRAFPKSKKLIGKMIRVNAKIGGCGGRCDIMLFHFLLCPTSGAKTVLRTVKMWASASNYVWRTSTNPQAYTRAHPRLLP